MLALFVGTWHPEHFLTSHGLHFGSILESFWRPLEHFLVICEVLFFRCFFGSDLDRTFESKWGHGVSGGVDLTPRREIKERGKPLPLGIED